ncbi:MAG: hypothetical protein QW498_08380 [Thermofilum sp.]
MRVKIERWNSRSFVVLVDEKERIVADKVYVDGYAVDATAVVEAIIVEVESKDNTVVNITTLRGLVEDLLSSLSALLPG